MTLEEIQKEIDQHLANASAALLRVAAEVAVAAPKAAKVFMDMKLEIDNIRLP
jgi:hypothetical protein